MQQPKSFPPFAESPNLFHFTLFHKFYKLKEVSAFLMKAIHHSSIQKPSSDKTSLEMDFFSNTKE
jgi:hypothetical protein